MSLYKADRIKGDFTMYRRAWRSHSVTHLMPDHASPSHGQHGIGVCVNGSIKHSIMRGCDKRLEFCFVCQLVRWLFHSVYVRVPVLLMKSIWNRHSQKGK